MEDNTKLDCGHEPTSPRAAGTTGYGEDEAGRKHCFDCCAKVEREEMLRTGRGALYLAPCVTPPGWEVSNWPGTLRFACTTPRVGRHNIARRQATVWFRVPLEGGGYERWIGRQYGDNSTLAHCRRLTGRP